MRGNSYKSKEYAKDCCMIKMIQGMLSTLTKYVL